MISTQKWQERLANLNKEKDALLKKSSTFVFYRLISFVIILLGIFTYYQYIEKIGYFICGIGLLLLLYFIYQHSKVNKAILYNQRHQQVIQKYIDRRNDDWMNFTEKGEEFIEECDPTFLDLDIIGNHSLYQLLCVAKSALGKRKLYEYFANKIDLLTIAKRQAAIEELANKLEDCINLQIALAEKKVESDRHIKINDEYLKEFEELKEVKGLSIVRWIPLLTIGIGILMILSICPAIIFYGLLFIQFIISAFYTLKESKRIACYQGIHAHFAKDAHLYEICETIEFESKLLKKLQSDLTRNAHASILLKRLDSDLSMFSLRNNVLLYVAFNALFMFDIQYLYRIEKWRINHANSIQNWCLALAHIEALLSCSLLNYARDHTCIAQINKNDLLQIQASNCGHPLINEQEVVQNDFSLQGNSMITGSNMSGKSTFMRCVGLNVILANAGCRVCADTFTCSLMEVVSSMRLKDELSSGISSFYAEVLRIKAIMEKSKNQQPVLILIDEIFKGTNSIDRISGAKEVIKKLNQSWIISMITTHDLELCDEWKDLHNYHFREHYIDNEIHFDYILHPGRCTTTNAIHLMKMAGIIE